ncbi:MAG: phosphate ABC transporter permease PstA [Planctomycetota bacterium]|nr:phosphate ABC transporter permease PstA [Planctomycetota bacterium]
MKRRGFIARFSELFFTGLTAGAAALIVLSILVFLVVIVRNGVDSLTWEYLSTSPRGGIAGEGGIFPAIFGTIVLVFLMTIAVMPLGVLTAVYLHEYAPKNSRLVGAVRLAVQNLAGVPSIVFGLFGLGFFVQYVGGGIDELFYGGRAIYGQPAIVWAALTYALLTLPTVIVATEESLRAVPDGYREVAYGLGASRWQVTTRVVLPNSMSGILTGGILAISRATGEVAPIIFTGVAFSLPYLPTRLNHQFTQLGYHIYILATQSPDIEKSRPLLFSAVLVLVVITFALVFFAIILRSRIRRKLRAGY